MIGPLDYVIPFEAQQAYLCRLGEHHWASWSDFVPVMRKISPYAFSAEPPSFDDVKIEAYRWRYCRCGARQRESWNTHERITFPNIEGEKSVE
jgi:hypothetical protein